MERERRIHNESRKCGRGWSAQMEEEKEVKEKKRNSILLAFPPLLLPHSVQDSREWEGGERRDIVR